MKKKGFTVFLSNENFPNELVQNRCLALTADVVDESSLFKVKSKIQLKDCFGVVIYTSQEGRSKEKDYKKSYHEAIRKAYASLEALDYSYEPLEVKSIKKETVTEKGVEENINAPIREVISGKTKVPVKIVSDVNVVIPVREVKTKIISTELLVTKNVLYAQAIENGFQLVNTKPSLVFQLLKTKVKDVFIIKNKNGILYKSGNTWVAEYYNKTSLVVERYQIKF
ncbi:MAG: hypothetical protein V3V28_11855 [Polaribacter sp.]|uniref:hypothetical protein n=1 Tax=Polaribacter sp. TaxID=1920175 RepID=UPI002F35C75B